MNTGLFGGKNKLIAIHILKLRESAPRLFRGRSRKQDSAILQLLIGPIDVVRHKCYIGKGTDPIFMARGREQNYLGLAAWNPQFDPALFLVKWLVGQDLESKLLRVKTNGLVLIAHRNAHELERLDHNHPPQLTVGGGRWPCKAKSDHYTIKDYNYNQHSEDFA